MTFGQIFNSSNLNTEIQILIVEDDEIDQRIIKRALRKSDLLVNITIVDSANEALALFDSKNKFDCCIFDYLLPDLNGIDLTIKARKKGQCCPIIIITSQTDPQLATKAIEAGAINFITKSLITSEGISLIIRNSIALRKIENELEISQKKALKYGQIRQTFLANMSHEIRSPLNAILGFSKLMLDKKLDIESMDYIETIYNSAENLLVIINDVLDISKIESGKLNIEVTKFQIRETTSHLKKVFRNITLTKKIDFNINIAPSIPTYLKGDKNRIHQVLTNLLSNAIKFTSKGKVELNISLIESTKSTVKLLFEVKDTGIGIAADKQQIIFESFTQAESNTTRKFGGTGLGLTIVKDLVLLMGGEIQVKSQLNKGATFSFELDFEKSLNDNLERSLNSDFIDDKIIYDFSKIKILAAEDNKVNQKLLKIYLEKLNCQFEIVENGKEALEKINKNTYDIVLMDIQMPIMDGIEATVNMRNQNVKTPIIAMTAHALQEEKEKCKNVGMNGYITKPFKFEELIEVIIENIQHVTINNLSNNLLINKPKKMKKDLLDFTFIKNELDSNEEVIREMLLLFKVNISEFRENIALAILNSNLEQIGKESHKILPGLHMFGLIELYENIKTIEKLVNEKVSITEIIKRYQALDSIFIELKTEIIFRLKNFKIS